MIAEMPHPSAGVVKNIKSAMHFSETPLAVYHAPPTLGQNSTAILAETLGLSDDEINALGNEGAFSNAPSGSGNNSKEG